ncbi:enolase [Candidatus Woesearchaeota archaeon]|nr:enolase [Candidatus Woesearchaeota archaeon]
MIIKKVKAKKIRNSRGEETIKIQVKSDKGKGEASAPSGASKGKYEAKDYVLKIDECIKFINDCKELEGLEINNFDDLKKIESIVNKTNLGANPTIALEYAVLKCLGSVWKTIDKDTRQISKPLGNVIGGGKHIKNENHCEFQEFLLLPFNSKNFSEAMNANKLAHELVKKKLKKMKLKVEMTDEGAWAPNLKIEEILDLLKEVVSEVQDETKIELKIGIDVAANSFFDGKNYIYRDKKLNPEKQVEYISELIEKYKLHYIEDPLMEEDFKGFAKLNNKFGTKCMITGDDLTVTNMERLKLALKNKSINSMIIKPNQNGSLISTKEVIEEANKNKLYLIISHRSGETNDATISHLAIGFKIPIIKCGIFGEEREVKLKEIIKIENQIKYNN